MNKRRTIETTYFQGMDGLRQWEGGIKLNAVHNRDVGYSVESVKLK